jgi:hypothetical protein
MYSRAAYDAIADWETMFGAIEPVRGTAISEYLTGAWVDVGQTN